MNWQQFLEKSWQARPDQKVTAMFVGKTDIPEVRVFDVVGIDFTNDHVIIQMDETE